MRLYILCLYLMKPFAATLVTNLNSEPSISNLNSGSAITEQDLLAEQSVVEFAKILVEKSQDMPKVGGESFDPAADLRLYNHGLTNEDKDLNGTELITKYGYPIKLYNVWTKDGYYLTLAHIPGRGKPVFLMHGLISSFEDFLISGPEGSLAFVLAEAGFDVWMGNARGNKYSNKHDTLKPSDDEFWNFDWNEIGMYDVPAMIDFVLEITGHKKLYYIGHSQGTTVSYVMLSQMPEYNKKIDLVISLSPVAWMKHVPSSVFQSLVPFRDNAVFISKTIGAYEFSPSNGLVSLVRSIVCAPSVLATAVCGSLVSPLYGFDYEHMNMDDYAVQINHLPAGSATKQVIHYLQLGNSNRFCQFDYGRARNQELYGRATPPDYDLSKVITPVALFYSKNDWMSSPIDVSKLASALPNAKLYLIPESYSHTSFLWAYNAPELIYSQILELFEKISRE